MLANDNHLSYNSKHHWNIFDSAGFDSQTIILIILAELL